MYLGRGPEFQGRFGIICVEKSINLGIRGFSAKNSFLDTFSETAPLKFLIFSMITEGGKSLELSIWEIIYII